MVCLLRWTYAPDSTNIFTGLVLVWHLFTNHQTLICARGIEIAILRAAVLADLLFFNSVIFVVGLLLMANGMLAATRGNTLSS